MTLSSILLSVVYTVVGLWLTMRIIAVILQFVIRRKTGILVKIARVGFGAFHKIHISVKQGLQVEIDKVWISSSYVNDQFRQPLVLCLGEVRIQANTNEPIRERAHPAPTNRKEGASGGVHALLKLATYIQHFGIRIDSLTVMLLKTMIADCLIHVEGQGLGLDISCIEDSLQVIVNAGSVTCRALRSVVQTDGNLQDNKGPCLAEMSFSLYADLCVYQSDITKLKRSRLLVKKPQIMLTEGLLSGTHYLKPPTRPPDPQQDVLPDHGDGANPRIFSLLPQELGIDISEVDVKIVRETKQSTFERSLSVVIKTFHIDLFNEIKGDHQEISCTLLIEDFSTKSQQARFAELLKWEIKSMVNQTEVRARCHIDGAYFHYHHDEVQYWLLVISQFTQQGHRGQPELIQQGHRGEAGSSNSLAYLGPSTTLQRQQSTGLRHLVKTRLVIADVELSDISTSFSTASCPGLVLGVCKVIMHIIIKPGTRHIDVDQSMLKSHSASVDLELNTLYCTNAETKTPIADLAANKHYWKHVAYLTRLVLEVHKVGDELRVQGESDHLHLEWSTETVNIIIALVTALSKAKISAPRKFSESAIFLHRKEAMNIPVGDTSQLSNLSLVLKLDVTNMNLFLCNNYNVCLMLRLDASSVKYRHQQADVTIEGTKLKYLPMENQSLMLSRSDNLDHPAASLKEIRIKFNASAREGSVQLAKELVVDWTTACHMCIIQAIEDVTELKNKLWGEEVSTINTPPPPEPPRQTRGVSMSLMINTEVKVTIHLSSQHSVTLRTDNILMSLSPQELVTEINSLSIFCDEERIFLFGGLLFGTLPDVQLRQERKNFKNLILNTNRAWNISMETLDIIFPHSFDFAECFEEFINFQKWLKQVHHLKKKPFTVDSKLPPDLLIKVKNFRLEIGDNPFEVKLGDNYELMKDEYLECEKRRNVLDQKVQTLKKGYGIIPAHKIEEVYASLDKSSSDIYIQRSRQLYLITPPRSKLFTWLMEDVEIVALADTSIHGKDNVVANMRDVDPDSPYPDEGLEFVTLWCRYVNTSVKSWTFQFRDYPQLPLKIQDMNIWGRLIGSEVEGAKRAKRSCVVEVAEPWGNMTVLRNLPALKFTHDFSADVESFEMAYGACWEPVTAEYNLALDLINKPSVDPSSPLPWWDKIRLLLHGRLTMTVLRMSWLYHASLDPYNTTELMDWTWSDLVLDWTNMKFLLKGNLDIYARTASKYDDCKLLHLPNLKFCAKIDWLSLGDPNDHHLVMPCAPDKVPEFSLEEHDSFRAFRSQNLNLSITLETSKKKDPRGDKPSGLFYSSTLRFMEKIGQCLASITRPIRRGKLFQNTKARKPMLSRHYKYAQLSVNFHQFDVDYWMSFSRQHGAKFSGNSFVLELRNELSLHPVEDGLYHRPQADWSVIYLNCLLSGTKIWLCSSQERHEDELDQSSAGRPVTNSFFLSVSKVSYQRSSSDHNEIPDVQSSKTPTHNLQVYEMRGSWNKENRTVLVGLYDSYMKVQSLKRNLSAEALKGFKVEGGANMSMQPHRGSSLHLDDSELTSPSPSSKMQAGHAHSMLMKLVAESDSKSVAFTEEPSSANMDQLHGIAACQGDDIVQKNWHIELHNSQIIVKGCETQGFLIVAAAKAKVLSCTHTPVWVRDNQLRSKNTWSGSLECMQYYATVDPGPELTEDNIPWLSKTHVEDRSEPDPSSLQEMAGSGHSVGGIVNTSYSGAHKHQTIQMQRIISRCKCQFFYVNYGEADPLLMQEVPPPPQDDSDMMQRDGGVDTFTLLHHDLNVCTNHLQYNMILDIVNNLLLHVELKKKEVTEKLQSMRFQLQLSRVEDQKTPILSLQESVRQHMEKYRYYEKELFLVLKAKEEEENVEYQHELLDDQETLQMRLRQCKDKINTLNEELAIRISCFKESQLQVQSSLQKTQTQQAYVIRRNEVCFKFAQWRLTEPDGQVGISDLALRNFVYTKVNRDNDTWSHQVELGWVKVTNLLPNSIYKDVLVPREIPTGVDNRKMTLRVLCTERPPVGGIAVKEHFEVNLVPLQIQMTYHLYKKIMAFFFPDKDIDKEDQDDDVEGASSSKPFSRSEKRSSQRSTKEIKRTPSFTATDDIDKMKERAANNNTFLYIKVPEVSLRVSYKGEKEKNIIDVHDFSLVLPTLEYHNCIWTWFDLLMTMKNDSKRVLISQAIKQKLHMRNRLSDDPPLTDVQQEEDKAKMLLGAKVLAPQEKPAKKTLFGKSQK
ncbi:protein KIAA0100-like isoform X2 [Dreissena polymorpha]|uniref:protein KIAA0100-like isoform X2 n=1 Tax=Dreissena polymorpha TaxID=45954 RepID=UPI002264AF79|nr:protein KIAA0100-like isoform X2 [Dreissena polymorpha]